MICNKLLLVIILSIFGKGLTDFSSDCERKGKATASLDFAMQLIQNARDNFPVCTSKCFSMDCEDVLQNGQNESGIYEVWPRSRVIKGPVKVYCDMETDGGGWTVIQRRGNYGRPKDFFYQDWKTYKEGFGNVEEDFWLGNDNIYGLSHQRMYSARFDLMDVEKTERYALYDNFWIDDEEHKYTLHLKGYSGDAGDSIMGHHGGQKFSTKDRDNDNNSTSFCAERCKGGWWYNSCYTSNLNGVYHSGKFEGVTNGVTWSTFKGYKESLESTEIKIRGKDFRKYIK